MRSKYSIDGWISVKPGIGGWQPRPTPPAPKPEPTLDEILGLE